MAKRYDAVIVGGGHNGLVTAAYLAKAGRKVLVLERREMVGGCSVTEEIWPGFRVSTAAYLTSLLQERVIRDLDLPRHGYAVHPKDPSFFSAFPDGRHLFFWQDRQKTLSEIGKFSPRDAGRFGHGRFRYGPWRGGRDPLAPPYDVREAVDRLGEEVLADGNLRERPRPLGSEAHPAGRGPAYWVDPD